MKKITPKMVHDVIADLYKNATPPIDIDTAESVDPTAHEITWEKQQEIMEKHDMMILDIFPTLLNKGPKIKNMNPFGIPHRHAIFSTPNQAKSVNTLKNTQSDYDLFSRLLLKELGDSHEAKELTEEQTTQFYEDFKKYGKPFKDWAAFAFPKGL